MAHAMDDLRLGTTLVRTGTDGEPVECDIVVNFAATMTHPGYRQTWMQPAEAAEFEIEFIGAELDGQSYDALGPLTEIELSTLRRWFDEHEGQAWECANDNREI